MTLPNTIRLLLLCLLLCHGPLLAQNRIITIEGGKRTTSSTTVAVALAPLRNPVSMQLSESYSFLDASWEPYRAHFSHTFSEGDGQKELFVRFRHEDNSFSEIGAAAILLDTQPPTAQYLIPGLKYTSNRSLLINLQATGGATQMQISHKPQFEYAPWVPYQPMVRDWQLPDKDGAYQVYARFRDEAGNVSGVVQAPILLDRKGPAAKMLQIDLPEIRKDEVSGIPYVHHMPAEVTLQADAEEASWVMFSHNPDFLDASWQPLRPSIRWRTQAEGMQEGIYRLYAKFRDKAGNESAPIAAQLYVDHLPPREPKVRILQTREALESAEVLLSLQALEAEEVMLSNYADFRGARWQHYKTLLPWTLDPEGERCTIYARFRDRAHNETQSVSHQAFLDITPPQQCQLQLEYGSATTRKKEIVVRATASDAAYVRVSEDSTFANTPWQLYHGNFLRYNLGNEGGMRTLYAQFMDRMRNRSEVVASSIRQLIVPVNLDMKIDNDSKFSTAPDATVELQLQAHEATEMMVSQSADFAGASWEPYQSRKRFQLINQDGEQCVYVKFRSRSQTESVRLRRCIVLDRMPPAADMLTVAPVPYAQRVTGVADCIVQVRAPEAATFQVSTYEDFRDASWRGYTESPFSFSPKQDGQRLLYARFRDLNGNISSTASCTLSVDSQPPRDISMQVLSPIAAQQAGLHTTQEATVSLGIQAPEEVTQVRIGQDAHFTGSEWQPFQRQLAYTLKGQPGSHTLYVQLADKSQNRSRLLSQSLLWDRTPPQGVSAKIGEGGVCTHPEGRITLLLQAQEAAFVAIQDTPFGNSPRSWMRFRKEMSFLLQGQDGPKKVYVLFADIAGNETAALQLPVLLDRQQPLLEQVSINEDAPYAKERTLRLQLKAQDAQELIVGPSPYFAAPAKWEPFLAEKTYTLPEGDGKISLYVKVRDQAGHESEVLQAGILLDTAPPVLSMLQINKGATATEALGVKVQLKAQDAQDMQLSNSPDFRQSLWVPYQEEAHWTLAGKGMQRVFVRFRDKAGNVSAYWDCKIMVY